MSLLLLLKMYIVGCGYVPTNIGAYNLHITRYYTMIYHITKDMSVIHLIRIII